MLVVRAPMRISLAGGGTDMPAYYERHGGMVVSTSIDKYFTVQIKQADSATVAIESSDFGLFARYRARERQNWDGDLGLVKAILHDFGVQGGISLALRSDIPPGTGLGSSSTVAVAMIKALSTWQGDRLSPDCLAERACRIELEKLAAPIGKQDQYAAAFGGLNAIQFTGDGVTVRPVKLSPNTVDALERRLLLFFTGRTRSANAILREQRQAASDARSGATAALHAIKEAAAATRACLEAGDLDSFGQILRDSWEQKKRLASGISNERIDALYDLAQSHGAVGGKLAGAGGEGFLMLYCREGSQDAVTAALGQVGLSRMAYCFDRAGAHVVVDERSERRGRDRRYRGSAA